MNIVVILFLTVLLVLTVLMCFQESQKRKINFFVALIICVVLSPLFGYLIISSFKLRNPRGCEWCGNTHNEAEYCGLCGKNQEGKTRKALSE